jgi:Do/DeqQ family serine protease
MNLSVPSPHQTVRALALAGSLGLLALIFGHHAPSQAALPPSVDGQALPSLAPMLERVMPAVVNINTKTRVRVNNPLANDPFFRQFFGLQNAPRERIEQSLGSGVIIDAAKGYVVTNNHVIQGADDISVTLQGDRTVHGTLIGSDAETDIAVVQIPAENLIALPLADSSRLRVGDFVVAIGEPFGLGQTVTSGIVSAVNRAGHGLGYQNYIQTDASINPGNSGGALVNLKGELVGINSAIYSPSGGNVGIGFAIPSNMAADAMRQLVATGRVRHGSLGLAVQTLTPQIARQLGLRADQPGAVVTDVRAGSAAASAGVAQGDVIVAANGRSIANEDDLHTVEGTNAIGANIDIKVLREGKPQTLSTRLEAETINSSDGGKLDVRLGGAELADAGERIRREGLRGGVSVLRVTAGSRAAKNGLKQGDVIVAVNQVEIGGLADLKPLATQPVRQLQLAIVRGGRLSFVQMQ